MNKHSARSKLSFLISAVLVATPLIGLAAANPADAAVTTVYSCPGGGQTTQIGTDGSGMPICETIFDASGTFTVPNGVTKVDAFLLGGGGAGGSGNTDAEAAILAGGGGAGGSQAIYKDVAVSGTVSVTVGAGGAGSDGTANGVDGPNGGTTEFGTGGTIVALGGDGGKAGTTAVVGAGGSSHTNPGADATSEAFSGAAGAAFADWDINHWFTAGGGGAGSASAGIAGSYGTCVTDAGCAVDGGDGGNGSVITLAGSQFEAANWADSLGYISYVGFGFGGGAGTSGVSNDPATIWGDPLSPAQDYIRGNHGTNGVTPRDANWGTGGDVFSKSITARPTTSGGIAHVMEPNYGGGGGGGVGDYLDQLYSDYSGAGGNGLVILRYIAGPMSVCDTTNSTTTAVDGTITEVEITGECAWNVPVGVTSVDLLAIGAGGGGGGASYGAGGGGSAGEVTLCPAITVAAGDAFTGEIGHGGNAGDETTYGYGGNGGDTNISYSDGTIAPACDALGGYGADQGNFGGDEMGSWEYMGPHSGSGAPSANSLWNGGTGSAAFTWDIDNGNTFISAAGGGGAGSSQDGATPLCDANGCDSSAGGDGTIVSNIAGADLTTFIDDARQFAAGGGGGTFFSGADALSGAGGSGNGGSGNSIDTATAGSDGGSQGSGGGGAYAGTSTGFSIIAGGKGGEGGFFIRYITPPAGPTLPTLYVVPSDAETNYGTDAGSVTFGVKYYSDSELTTEVVDPSAGSTNAGWAASICNLAPTAYSATTAVGTYTDEIECSLGNGGADYILDETATATLTVKKAVASVSYTGGTSITPGASLTLSATVTPGFCTGAVSYSLNKNPLTGAVETYPITGPSVLTTGWLPGTYAVTVSYVGDDNCLSAISTPSNIVLKAPCFDIDGNGTYGYASTKASFNFDIESGSTGMQRSPLNWTVANAFKFTGNMTTYSNAAGVGTSTGTGTLSYWKASGRSGSWISATTGPASVTINFTASVTGRRNVVLVPATFAIGFTGTKVGASPALPTLGSPVNLTSGKITYE